MGQALMKAVAEAGHEVSGGVDAGESPGPLATRCHVLRSEEHTSELQSLMRISYAVFCLKKNTTKAQNATIYNKLTISTQFSSCPHCSTQPMTYVDIDRQTTP